MKTYIIALSERNTSNGIYMYQIMSNDLKSAAKIAYEQYLLNSSDKKFPILDNPENYEKWMKNVKPDDRSTILEEFSKEGMDIGCMEL